MKPLVTLILLIIASSHVECYSQRIVYGYDEAGNRISKSSMSNQARSRGKVVDDVSIKYDVVIDQPSVQVEGNIITVTFIKRENSSGNQVSIYDMKGLLVIDKQTVEEIITVSIEDLPQGTYILKAKSDEQEVTFKFIRQ